MSNTSSPVNKSRVIPGEQIGQLTVLHEVRGKKWGTYVLCRCVCGKEVEKRLATIRGHFKNGDSVPSCGCRGSKTYKAKWTRIYRIWSGMKTRCSNPKAKDYANYGGRGIRVYKQWETFEGFLADMGTSYAAGLTLDRVDPDGNYEPSNCRWVSGLVQARNKRNTVTHEGKPLTQVAEETGIAYATLISRYALGDRGDRLVRPVQQKRR